MVALLLVSSGFVGVSDSSVESIFDEKEMELTTIMSGSSIIHQWPMYKHDPQHTGRSPYDAGNNLGGELWKYLYEYPSICTAVIDMNRTLYVSTFRDLHAVYPNGTGKWIVNHHGSDGWVPTIGPDGTIYLGTNKRFCAYYPNGTIKWILNIEKKFSGYPTVGPDGTVYVGTGDGYLYAVHPNGTIAWEYYNGYDYIFGPAVDNQGNIYFTTVYKNSLYCLNQNGSLQWKYTANNDFNHGPVIGDDGTIYVVAIHRLIAVNPDGTEKWNIWISDWAGFPCLAPDGTIILSGCSEYITALDPSDGGILWQFQIYEGVYYIDVTGIAIGGDGTVYFAYTYADYAGYLCALTPNGNLKWETHLTSNIQPYDGLYIRGDPSIGADGTVYITTWFSRGGSNFTSYGYLYAIGNQNSSAAPEIPIITGKTNGLCGEEYEYTFQATSPTGEDVYYFIDWGDYSFENWFGSYPSGTPVTVNHSWDEEGTFNIKAKAKTADGLCGPWGELEVTMPVNQQSTHPWFYWFFERFPNAFPILRFLLTK